MENSQMKPVNSFEQQLQTVAKQKMATIVLPESADLRILQATHYVLEENIANIILLGEAEKINKDAEKANLNLSKATIVDPSNKQLLNEYAQEFARIRASKGVTFEQAYEQMQDECYFATMMVHKGAADAMVCGAIHTTADTIRPAFQIIKTKENISVVSSVFLMVLGEQVLFYGDCAVNPNPDSKQLAEIAYSSARTAKQFGIEPKVALLSYSSGASGKGKDVDLVVQATQYLSQMNPDFDYTGPIQYDAAVDEQVAKLKMPDDKVAGKANVMIFPDLSAGNICYKAVQRSAGALAIGPVLQGLNKPINDLSRGATVQDIINTIVISAIQAQ